MLTESKENPIKLWITGTEGRQPVLSVHCLLSVSVVSSAKSLSVSVIPRNVFIFWWMCISQTLVSVLLHVSQLTFSLYSHTNALGSNTTVHGAKPTEYECCFVAKACRAYTLHSSDRKWSKSQSKMYINMKIYNTRTITKSIQQKVTQLWYHIALTNSLKYSVPPFPQWTQTRNMNAFLSLFR